jgi:hypothetical protein
MPLMDTYPLFFVLSNLNMASLLEMASNGLYHWLVNKSMKFKYVHMWVFHHTVHFRINNIKGNKIQTIKLKPKEKII